jgi:hypothetical protein
MREREISDPMQELLEGGQKLRDVHMSRRVWRMLTSQQTAAPATWQAPFLHAGSLRRIVLAGLAAIREPGINRTVSRTSDEKSRRMMTLCSLGWLRPTNLRTASSRGDDVAVGKGRCRLGFSERGMSRQRVSASIVGTQASCHWRLPRSCVGEFCAAFVSRWSVSVPSSPISASRCGQDGCSARVAGDAQADMSRLDPGTVPVHTSPNTQHSCAGLKRALTAFSCQAFHSDGVQLQG